LHYVAGLRMPSLISELLALAAEVDACTAVGDTPLRVAASSRDLEAVEVLCNARANPNSANRSGCAPIHAAVALGDKKLTELLVGFGADVHLADDRRWCPVHYGAMGGSGEVIECLISNRADPYTRSYHGRTAQDLGRAGATDALVRAACRNPPPREMLEPGPREVQRPMMAKRECQTVVLTKTSVLSNASPPSRSVLSTAGSAQSQKGYPSKTSLDQGMMSQTNESWAQPLSNASWEDSDGGFLPPIAMASKVRAGGTPRGSIREDGNMKLRLFGTGCKVSAPLSGRKR